MRRAGLVAAALAALGGAAAAFALVALSPRAQTGRAVATVGDDYYARLKPHPTVVEPVAGEVGGTPSGSYRVVEPVVGGGGAAAAPARGARGGPPSDAQIRRELARLPKPQRDRAYSNPPGVGPVAPFEPAGGWHTSVASVYTDYGGPLACGGRLGRHQLGVAHKSAPCGALVTFRYNGRVLRVPVIDRGPYIAGREWDLTGATAEALGFPGLDFIDWTV
ncbi:MAG: rare lipoprotein [Solirubrobacteraceae bacterium]|jgi:hypothetical protein|nr:rare lipoprotein [Solirubrobacteraceae bacterium]